jgi:hypothetical protein
MSVQTQIHGLGVRVTAVETKAEAARLTALSTDTKFSALARDTLALIEAARTDIRTASRNDLSARMPSVTTFWTRLRWLCTGRWTLR